MAVNKLDARISELYSEYEKAVTDGEIIDAHKIQLNLMKVSRLRDHAVDLGSKVRVINDDMVKYIPDLEERTPKIRSFINEILGQEAFTEEEFNLLTNTNLMGRAALKMNLLVTKLYDQVNDVEKKLVKDPPSALSRPGTGTTGTTSVKKTNADAAKKAAINSGDDVDWAEWIDQITTKQN